LFVAHHLDDNLETYLLRKVAGSNFEGLNCIENNIVRRGVQILRPLLTYKKSEIINFNDENKIEYINDPTNKNANYSRTIVRNFLLSNPQYKNKIKKDLNYIKSYYPFYKEMIFYFFNKINISCSKKKIILNLDSFLNLEKEIQIKIVELIYKYLRSEKKLLRYVKTLQTLDHLCSKNAKNTNLAGMKVIKSSENILFSL